MGLTVLIVAELIAANDALFIPYLVFAVITLYGSMNIIAVAKDTSGKRLAKNYIHGFCAIFLALIVLIMALVGDNTVYIACVVWAVWSILKEGHTLQNEMFGKVKNKAVLILNIVLSVAVCVFSAFMIIDPLNHIHAHIVLLGVGWIIEAVNALVFAITEKQLSESEKDKNE